MHTHIKSFMVGWVHKVCLEDCIWATTRQKQQNDLCAQRRLRSESFLSAWRKLGSLATHWAHSKDSDQTGRMLRLIWVFAGCTCHFVGFVTMQLIFQSTGPCAFGTSEMKMCSEDWFASPCVWTDLTYLCLGSLKWVLCKQCRPNSAASIKILTTWKL